MARLSALQPPSLLETAAALPHVHRLSRPRSTTAAPPRPGPIGRRWAQPRRRAGSDGPGQDRDGSRVHCRFARRRRSPTLPLRHRHGYPAALHRGLPAQLVHTSRRSSPPATSRDGCAPLPAQIRQVRAGDALRDVQRRFLAYSSPSRSPDPHHLAVLARPGFVRAAPTLPGTSRIRLPSASPPCCDRTAAKVSHLHSNHSASRRTQRPATHGGLPLAGPRS